jgi:hypothetical protein
LIDVWPRLHHDQLEDRGAFIIPNGGGHKGADISEIRAVWVDCDGKPVAEVLDGFDALGLVPHAVARREDAPDTQAHVYTFTAGLSSIEFTAAQRALAAQLGTDPRVIDPSRVMRLPGTFHMKPGKPPSRYLFEDLTFGMGRAFALSREQILAALPPLPAAPPRKGTVEPVTEAMVRDMLRHVDPGLPRVREGAPGWLAVISALCSAHVVTAGGDPDPDYDGLALCKGWSRGDLWPGGRPANYDSETDVTGEWDYRARSTRADLPGVGALVNLARDGGYTGPVQVAACVFEAQIAAERSTAAPLDILGASELTGYPELTADCLPAPLLRYVMAEAERLNVDPCPLALHVLAACATSISDAWRVQLKKNDPWAQQARVCVFR